MPINHPSLLRDNVCADVLVLEIGQQHQGTASGPGEEVRGSQAAAVIQKLLSGLSQQVLRLRYRPHGAAGQRFLEEPLGGEDGQKGFLTRITHMPAFWCCRMGPGEDGTTKPLGSPYSSMILGRGIVLQ